MFAVLLQEGDAPPNPALQFALNQAPAAAGTSNNAGTNAMQLMSLVPKQDPNGQRPYVHYEGSLTTPPCSETVQWFVFADTVTIPRSQVEQFQQFCDKASPGLGNARPLQPMNGRTFDYAQFL